MSRPTIGKWLLGVPLGLVLLMLMLLALADLFDRQLIADPLATRFEDATNRELRFGAFDLRWGWPFSLRAENVTLANAPWGRDEPMLQAPVVSIPLRPGELMDGEPYGRLRFQNPDVLLERSDDGELNWRLDTGPPQPDQPPALPVSLLAEGGELRYFEAPGTEPAATLALDRVSLTEPATSRPIEEDERLAAAETQALALSLEATRNGIPVSLDATLELAPQRYQGRGALAVGDSDLEVAFLADSSAGPMRLDASLDSGLLDISELARLLPTGGEAQASETTMALPRLDMAQGRISMDVAALLLGEATLRDLSAAVDLEDGRLAMETLEGRLGEMSLRATASLDTASDSPVLRLEADLPRQALSTLPPDPPFASRLSSQPGEASARIGAAVHMPDRMLPLTLSQLLARLEIPGGRFTYARQLPAEEGVAAGGASAEIIARLAVPQAGGEPVLNLEVEGIEAPPFDASVSAPPLRQLASESPWPVALTISTGSAQATLRARLETLLEDPGADIDFSASGRDLPALPAFGFTPPPLLPFEIEGTLRYRGRQIALDRFQASYGDSRVSGDAILNLEGEKPHLALDAEASLLDLTALPLGRATGGGQAAQGQSDGESDEQGGNAGDPLLPARLTRALAALDADVALQARRIRLSESVGLEDARLTASLEDGRLMVDDLHVEGAGGSLSGSLRANGGQPPVDGRIDLNLDGIRLGQVGDTFTPLEEYLGRLSGELRVDFAEAAPGQQQENVLLPSLGRLSLDGSVLRFEDSEAGTDLTVRLDTHGLDAPSREQRLSVTGEGRYRGEEAGFELNGDPLLALRHRERPYGLRLDFSMADTEIELEGQVGRPWSPQSARLEFAASGGNPARLQALFGPVVSPPLPPYDVKGMLTWEGNRLNLTRLDGLVGDSDLQGEISFAFDGGFPRVTAALRSNRLDLDDLSGVLGGAPATGEGETTSPAQEEAGQAREEEQRLLPRRQFDMAALKRARVDIDYAAEDVNAASMPLESVVMDIHMEDGHLQAQPIRFETGNGRVRLRLDLRAQEQNLQGVVDVEARGVDLAQALQDVEIASDSFGIIGGQGKFWMSGDSTAAMLGSADGGLMLMMTGGALDALLVEVAGLDIGEALLVAAGMGDPVPIDCAYASLHGSSGTLDVERFVVDTTDTTYYMEGSIDLRRENLDLTLYPEAKDLGIPAADSPIGIQGSFMQPQVDVLSGGLAARSLEALALSALASPAAALLPFVEFGAGDEPAVCGGWVEELREESRAEAS